MKLGVIGVGFVGGVTAEVLKKAHEVYLYDKYKSPYNEPISLNLLSENCKSIFLCVPTPMKKSGEIDYSNILDSLDSLLLSVKKSGKDPSEVLIIIRSTTVPGTTEMLGEKYPFRFAFNPEFLREKYALEDMQNSDRFIIGSKMPEDRIKVAEIYRPLFPNANYILTEPKTSEMIKYTANGMLTGQIALANEFYEISQALGVDYNEVKKAVLLDPRIARNIDVPGPDGDLGFGGKCFPKDLNAIIYAAREQGYNPYLLEEVWKLNGRIRKNKDWLNIFGATSANNFKDSSSC